MQKINPNKTLLILFVNNRRVNPGHVTVKAAKRLMQIVRLQ